MARWLLMIDEEHKVEESGETTGGKILVTETIIRLTFRGIFASLFPLLECIDPPTSRRYEKHLPNESLIRSSLHAEGLNEVQRLDDP